MKCQALFLWQKVLTAKIFNDLNLYHSWLIQQMTIIHHTFSQKIGFDISCKLSPFEMICINYQILFSEKNKKNISDCCLVKVLPRVLRVNGQFYHDVKSKYKRCYKVTFPLQVQY